MLYLHELAPFTEPPPLLVQQFRLRLDVEPQLQGIINPIVTALGIIEVHL
jgi:hypothetical protein